MQKPYTDGTYYIDMKDFEDVNPRFELRFENRYGFKLGYGIELIMPQTYNMGSTRIYTFEDSDTGKDFKAWVLSTINNAAYDWYKRCKKEGMPTPPSDLYVWAMEMASGAACPMLHHGTYNTSGLSIVSLWTFLLGPLYGTLTNAWYSVLTNTIAPDVLVFGVDTCSTSTLYTYTSHELAHATHFQQVGEDVLDRALWWADVINYEVACGVLNGGSRPYEHPKIPKEGKVGITEMWAYAVGHICGWEHRQQEIGIYWDKGKYWFAPEILLSLYEDGMTLKQICDSMTGGVVTLEEFQSQLVVNNSACASEINDLFNTYFND